jgi:fibronectin-binding autotransporter adhesin
MKLFFRLFLGLFLLFFLSVLANPTLSTEGVVSGAASVISSGNIMTIDQASNNAIIEWSDFSIEAGESVTFHQPTVDSRILNRVTGDVASTIAGNLSSNGIVYLVNPAGITFSGDAAVNVGGIFAAAANMSNSNFNTGINSFTDISGDVANYGSILSGGDVGLVAKKITENGHIVTTDSLVMVAGETGNVLIGEAGGNISVEVSNIGEPALGAGDVYSLGCNGGSINAGEIFLHGWKILIEDTHVDGAGATVTIGQKGTELQTSQVIIDGNTIIDVGAGADNNGGEITVWANDTLSFLGTGKAEGQFLQGTEVLLV